MRRSHHGGAGRRPSRGRLTVRRCMEPKRKSSGRQRPALLCGQPDTAHASAGSRRGARRQREDQRHEQARPQAARQDGTLLRNGHGGSASCEIRQNPASAVSAVLFPLSPVPPEITIPLYVDVHFLHRGGSFIVRLYRSASAASRMSLPSPLRYAWNCTSWSPRQKWRTRRSI